MKGTITKKVEVYSITVDSVMPVKSQVSTVNVKKFRSTGLMHLTDAMLQQEVKKAHIVLNGLIRESRKRNQI